MEEKLELENCRAVEELLDVVDDLLAGLFQSGFCTIYDSTLNGIYEYANHAEKTGLVTLSKKLSELYALLEKGRHQMKKETGQILEIYGQIYHYIMICRERVQLDAALCYYR